MWKEYRKAAPKQELSGKNMKLDWEGGKEKWISNPREQYQN